MQELLTQIAIKTDLLAEIHPHSPQPKVMKTRKNDKNAKNRNFIPQFLLLLIGKTAENGKNAKNQNFIPQFLLLLMGKTAENDKNAKNRNFIPQFLLLLMGKTAENGKNAKNQNFEAVAIPPKIYKTISVINNQRSWLFAMFFAMSIAMLNFPTLSLTHAKAADLLVLHYPSISDTDGNATTIQQFSQQINLLKSQGYEIYPLKVALTKIFEQNTPNTNKNYIALTYGATNSNNLNNFTTQVLPILISHNIPMTIYWQMVPADKSNATALRQLFQEKLLDLADANFSDTNLLNLPDKELYKIIKRSNRELRQLTKRKVEIIIFPQGINMANNNPNAIKNYQSIGYRYGFIAADGIITANDHPYNLTAIGFSRLNSSSQNFAMVLNSRGIAVKDFLPINNIISKQANPPKLGFSIITDNPTNANNITKKINCQIANINAQQKNIIGNRVEFRWHHPLPAGVQNLNCNYIDQGMLHLLGRNFMFLNNP